jgi:hypothetical protein
MHHFPEVDMGLANLNLPFSSDIFPPLRRCTLIASLSAIIFLKMAAPFEFAFFFMLTFAFMLNKGSKIHAVLQSEV